MFVAAGARAQFQKTDQNTGVFPDFAILTLTTSKQLPVDLWVGCVSLAPTRIWLGLV